MTGDRARRPKVADLALHVEQLCTAHGISVWPRKAYGGWAARRQRVICIRPVKTQRTYVVALHEIGHIVGPRQRERRLEQEGGAWQYALETSIVPLTPGTYRLMLRHMDGLLTRAHRRNTRRPGSMIIPGAGSAFWATYAAIKQGSASAFHATTESRVLL